MVRCIDCVKLEKCAKTSGKPQIAEIVPGCESGQRKPVTNGDKIRGMSDEELTEWFAGEVDCQYCHVKTNGCSENEVTCRKSWYNWLRQEATT